MERKFRLFQTDVDAFQAAVEEELETQEEKIASLKAENEKLSRYVTSLEGQCATLSNVLLGVRADSGEGVRKRQKNLDE